MDELARPIRQSLKERKHIWRYDNFKETKDYFIKLIQEQIPEVK